MDRSLGVAGEGRPGGRTLTVRTRAEDNLAIHQALERVLSFLRAVAPPMPRRPSPDNFISSARLSTSDRRTRANALGGTRDQISRPASA